MVSQFPWFRRAHIATLVLFLVLVLFIPAQATRSIPIIPTDTGRICSPGEFDNGNACQPCPPGTFQDLANQFVCKPCAPGGVSRPQINLQFYRAPTQCSNCTGLQFQDEFGQAACKTCPPNSIEPTSSDEPNVACNTCEAPQFVQRNQCLTCEAGKVLQINEFGKRSCSFCPSGTFTDLPNQTECITCQPGSRAPSSRGPCRACEPGTFSTGSFCEECAQGFHQPLPGTTSCAPCPPGTFTNQTGALFCSAIDVSVSCASGYFISDGQCDKCPEGSVSPGGSVTSCFECLSPSFPNESSSECLCGAGFQRVGQQDEPYAKRGCVQCPAHAISNGIQCECPAALYYDSTRQRCVCPPKQRFNGIGCELCVDDAVPGESDCDFCATRSAVNEETGRCEFCERRGAGNTFDGVCECPPGRFWEPRAHTCLCMGGELRPNAGGIRECIDCEAGEIAFRGRCMNRCMIGPPPFFSFWDGERCVPCGSGRQAVNGRCIPLSCPEGQQLNFDLGICECAEITLADGSCASANCGENLFWNRELGQCSCFYGFVLQDGVCVTCAAGYVTNLEGTKCIKCGSKRFREAGNEPLCRVCENADPDIETAAECVAGTCASDEFMGVDGTCQKCGKGQRMLNRRCVECAAGSVSAGGRTAFCSECIEGSSPNSERSECV
eukprot:TRINITY_DN24926_c0_g1_i1.p1 TRINITY_DN24926_c0_g1~~TRINITY_DN24926_c0_g1_i1.p1  ORF type:complete len:666 (-),score=23.02 TRINITY_DN24926_c0_g1_i1:130-2127(-)